jgi:hypothetical protein
MCSHLGALYTSHGKREQGGGLWRTIHLERRKGAGMAFKRLRHVTLLGVKLHVANNAALLRGDSDQNHPLLIGRDAIVDDLVGGQAGVALKHLDWIRSAVHTPVQDSGFGNETKGIQTDPFPEDDIFGRLPSLHLALHLNVEDLELPSSFRDSKDRRADDRHRNKKKPVQFQRHMEDRRRKPQETTGDASPKKPQTHP